MKILTNSQYETLVRDALESGYKKGWNQGFDDGYQEGMKAEKEGVHINGTGLYYFNNEEVKNNA
ncbi:hypothetical protein [Sediminibacillus massiliensis]|uniref:hypothetical protein n=1 Tax=Sediminibacillus massiliensis TaxID=1926277 RepID=UPI00098831A1|nr:hypothetical protein [Sediminibacillus massiliensis]